MRAALVILFVCLSLAGCDVAHGSAALRLNVESGQTAKFEMTMDQEIVQTVMGQEQRTEQTISYGWSQTTKRLDTDRMEISVVYDWVSVLQELPPPAGRIEFDSRKEDPQPGPAAAGFAAMVGAGFRIQVTPSGEILAVEGVTEMLDQMFSKLELPAEAEGMREALMKQFGDEAMKEFMQPFVSIYPREDVGVGDTWERTHVVTAIYAHVQENTYELLERADGVCKLGLRSEVTAAEDAPPMDMGMAKFQISMSGTQDGTLTLDEATGQVREGRIESKLSGEMQVLEQEMDPWPMAIEQVITLRRAD